MPISEQCVRARGGRAAARGASVRFQMRAKTDRIVDAIDRPRPIRQPRIPKRHELGDMIAQAREAVRNFPDSVSARRRLHMLLWMA
jgi:hypothetical protein